MRTFLTAWFRESQPLYRTRCNRVYQRPYRARRPYRPAPSGRSPFVRYFCYLPAPTAPGPRCRLSSSGLPLYTASRTRELCPGVIHRGPSAREGAYSAYASTRCIPYALGSGRFGRSETNETHARRMDIFLKWGPARVSRVRCPLLPLGQNAPLPKYLDLRRLGHPAMI